MYWKRTNPLSWKGKNKEDFKIEVENGRICISSENESSSETQEENYTRKEFSYEGFSRSFALPENVDDQSIKATYNDGMLGISIPKVEATQKSARSVEIS